MRVALVYLGRRGGGAAYSREVGAALARRCEVVAFVSAQAENLAAWRASGLAVTEVPTYATPLQFAAATLDVRGHRRLARRIREAAPDVLYHPMAHFWTPVVNALLPELPSVLTVHDPVLHLGEWNPLTALVTRWSIRQSARVVALTRGAAAALAAGGLSPARIDVVPHGEFGTFYRAAAPQEAAPRRDGQGLLFFGRLARYKGVGVLLEAFAELRRSRPAVRLTLVGSGDLGPHARALRALEGVTVVNRWIPDEEVRGFFAAADVVVLPYLDGTQSGVIPLAYGEGLPVVASDVGALREQVEPGVTGLLVPPGDARSLARACGELLDDAPRREAMGRRAREKAATEWSWDRVAGGVLAALTAAVAARRQEA